MTGYEKHAVQWEGITVEIRYCSNWSPSYRQCYGYDLAHVEIETAGTALPFTETGYLSHFDRADNVAAAGGPVALVLDWLEDAAANWRASVDDRQLSLL